MRIEPGTPVLLQPDGTARALSRVSFADGSLHEGLIQEIIFNRPSVLPVGEIDPDAAPLIPIGREIGTSAGPIDALYISPTGTLTVVEAKLWRNPEARRQVVGQIIDYATVLAGWSYDRLDAACRAASGVGLWDLRSANTHDDTTDEALWVDRVSRGLRDGRFLLLIVGDGIRAEVERMAAYVQASPQLQFSLAMIELRVYDDVSGTRLIVPSVVSRTTELVRSIVQVEVTGSDVEIGVTVPTETAESRRGTLTMSEFFETLEDSVGTEHADFVRGVFDAFQRDPRFALTRRAASVSLRLRHPTEGSRFTVLVFSASGAVSAGWLHDQIARWGVSTEPAEHFITSLSSSLGIPRHPRHESSLDRGATISEVAVRWDEVAGAIETLATSVTTALGREK